MKTQRFNITQFFFNAASNYPDKLAIIENKKKISYGQLAEEVKQTAAYFSDKGIVAGDRVLVFIPMSIVLCCKLAKCKGFVGTPKVRVMAIFAKELRRIPVKLNWRTRTAKLSSVLSVDPSTSALITFTTGSTGMPKAADRSHAFLAEQFSILKKKMDSRPEDVDMPILPIVLFINLGVGATSVIADYNSRKPASFEGARITEQLRKHKVNRLTASPYVVKRIGQYLLEKEQSLPDLRQIFTGGAPVFPSEAKIYYKAFPASAIEIIYGSTEAEPISTISVEALIEQEGMLEYGLPVGQVHSETKLRIVNLDNKAYEKISGDKLPALCLEEGRIGEILVSGAHVLKRYYNNPEAFRKNKLIVASSEGEEIWHRTGDSGLVKNGALLLTGRCKQLIRNGEKIISPFIIESQLQSLPGVTKGTIIDHNNELVIIAESVKSKEEVETLLEGFSYNKLIIRRFIPRDPRHHSKIDYALLKAAL